MGEQLSAVTDQSFEQEVIKSDVPVLVDFWAEWCHPCKMIAPTVHKLAEEYQGKAKVFQLNVDENNQTPSRYGVRGIPTLILFKGGAETDRIVGATSRDNIARMLDKALA